jgi:Leucine-rich repeat (LRR) protein
MPSKLSSSAAKNGLAKAKAIIQWREAGYPSPTDVQGPWLDHLSDELDDPPSADMLILAGLGLTSLPAEIAQLKGVEFLFLQHNQLASIDVSMIAGMGLKSLTLTGNPLQSVPAALFDIATLLDIYLDGAKLTTLPVPQASVEHVEILNLCSNPHLTLPEGFLLRLPNLKSLLLDGYAHTDIPPEVVHMPKLKQLSFDNSKITSLPDAIASMAELRQLSIEHAQLTSLPKSLAGMTQLHDIAKKISFMGLKLAGNPFTDKQLKKIAKLNNPARTEQALAWAAEYGSAEAG